MRLLIINPGSTSTKIAVYEDEREVFSENIAHTAEEVAPFARIVEQKGFRKDIILRVLKERTIDAGSFDAVVGRGGLLKPIPSGIYRGQRPPARGPLPGRPGRARLQPGRPDRRRDRPAARHPRLHRRSRRRRRAGRLGPPDRVSPEIKRRSIFHALNHKYSARLAARELGRPYEDCNFIVCHLGGGISIGAHEKGRVVDVNNALNGEGPITPERAGTIPAADLVDLCFSGKFAKDDLKKQADRQGRHGRPAQDQRHAPGRGPHPGRATPRPSSSSRP